MVLGELAYGKKFIWSLPHTTHKILMEYYMTMEMNQQSKWIVDLRLKG